MAKYSEDLMKRIIELVETDLFSVSEICKMTEINPKTFYEWKNTKPEFKEAFKEATRHRDGILLTAARIGLKQLLEGYTVQEEKVSYVPTKGNPANLEEKSRIIKKKNYPPNIRAIKMVLDRNDKTEALVYDQEPSVIIVKDEETKRQLMILRENKGEPGGALNPEIVARVDKMLEIEKTASIAAQADNEGNRREDIGQNNMTTVECKIYEKEIQNISYTEDTKKSINKDVSKRTTVIGTGTRVLPPGYYK